MESVADEFNEMPNLTIATTVLPALKDWQIGKTYTVALKVKLIKKGLGKHEYSLMDKEEKAEKEQYGTFKVIGAEDESDEPAGEKEFDESSPIGPFNNPLAGRKGK